MMPHENITLSPISLSSEKSQSTPSEFNFLWTRERWTPMVPLYCQFVDLLYVEAMHLGNQTDSKMAASSSQGNNIVLLILSPAHKAASIPSKHAALPAYLPACLTLSA